MQLQSLSLTLTDDEALHHRPPFGRRRNYSRFLSARGLESDVFGSVVGTDPEISIRTREIPKSSPLSTCTTGENYPLTPLASSSPGTPLLPPTCLHGTHAYEPTTSRLSPVPVSQSQSRPQPSHFLDERTVDLVARSNSPICSTCIQAQYLELGPLAATERPEHTVPCLAQTGHDGNRKQNCAPHESRRERSILVPFFFFYPSLYLYSTASGALCCSSLCLFVVTRALGPGLTHGKSVRFVRWTINDVPGEVK